MSLTPEALPVPPVVEAVRQLAQIDGCTYVAVEAVYRYEQDGTSRYYCSLSRWETSDARKLAAAYERIAALEAQLAQQAEPATASTNGHHTNGNWQQPPVECPLCQRQYRAGQSILVHLRKAHACNNLEEAHQLASAGDQAGGDQAAETEPEPEPEPE
jgi:hypothetical protein